MNFILLKGLPQNTNHEVVDNSLPGYSRISITSSISLYYLPKRRSDSIEKFELNNCQIFILGDLVAGRSEEGLDATKKELIYNSVRNNTVYELKGIFTLLVYFKGTANLEFHSSLFSVRPIYYLNGVYVTAVSSLIDLIPKTTDYTPKRSVGFIIEKLLFKYPFENRTIYSSIRSVPSCCKLEITRSSLSVIPLYRAYDFFVSNPEKWEKSLYEVRLAFRNGIKSFEEKEHALISLTGGFDGRTILATLLGSGNQISTYSYGEANSPDIIIPVKLSRELGFNHTSVLIGPEYAESNFLDDGLRFLEQSSYTGNISRAHYIRVADTFKDSFDHLYSGIFGSELLRSMKSPGVLASPVLYKLFSTNSRSEFDRFVRSYPPLLFLKQGLIEKRLPEIVDNIWSYKENLPSGLTVNQKFYTYIMEEAFRKYFGAEIMAVSDSINVRAPFLDYGFIRTLLKSGLAGVYSDFMEKNPLSRFKGQVLYSHIIQSTYPKLSSQLLDKGYSPSDLLTNIGKIRITAGFLKRKLLYQNRNTPQYSRNYFNSNKERFKEIIIDEDIFSVDNTNNAMHEAESSRNLEDYATLISLLYNPIPTGRLMRPRN